VLPETGKLRSRLAREQEEARALSQEIDALEAAAASRLVAGEARFHTWGFFELLVDRGRRGALVEPAGAEEPLRLALLVADHLDAAVYGAGVIEAARARAYAWLGNLWRVLSEFRRAEQAFREARHHLALSSMDPLDEALLLELEGSLRRAQRRFGEAAALLDRAISLYREAGEPHLQGRTLMIKGLVLQYSGDCEGAIVCFRNCLFLLDGPRDPRLTVAGQFNLIQCMFDGGHASDAIALIPAARRLLEKEGTRSDLLHLRWLEARVLEAQGNTEEAAQALLEVRNGFTESRLAFDAALVALDLAALYTRAGQAAQARHTAREILPIFQSFEIHREALAALIVLQKAAEMEQLSLSLVEEVATFLKRVRTEPGSAGLRFRADEAGGRGGS
jgi:tetratricopeptide (TPR) repeat protein